MKHIIYSHPRSGNSYLTVLMQKLYPGYLGEAIYRREIGVHIPGETHPWLVDEDSITRLFNTFEDGGIILFDNHLTARADLEKIIKRLDVVRYKAVVLHRQNLLAAALSWEIKVMQRKVRPRAIIDFIKQHDRFIRRVKSIMDENSLPYMEVMYEQLFSTRPYNNAEFCKLIQHIDPEKADEAKNILFDDALEPRLTAEEYERFCPKELLAELQQITGYKVGT